jgi:hypothetical protein
MRRFYTSDRFLNKVVKINPREVLLSTTAASMSQFNSTAAQPLAQLSASAIESCVLPAKERVTDGTRTRDLRSHNPMSSVSRHCCMLQNRHT